MDTTHGLRSTTWTDRDISDQRGKVAIVTGANSGIGYVTARELARRGARVVLACRDATRADAALARLRGEVPTADASIRSLDLASLSSIARFVADWTGESLDLLVNSAGVAMVPYARTADGFESHMGVNHLGTFALTAGLLPALLASGDARVVTVTSEGQRYVRVDTPHLTADRDDASRYHAAFAYWRSKQANVYFATELQRRAAASGAQLRSFAAVPGFCETNVLTGGAHGGRGRAWHTTMQALTRAFAKPTIEGAWTSLYAATGPDVPGGSYVAPRGPLEFRGPPVVRSGHRAAYDVDTARELWQASEELTGVVDDSLVRRPARSTSV